MSEYSLTQDGFVFRYTTGGAFVLVNQIDTPEGVPYDMMQMPQWVNRAKFDNTVLYQVAHEWLGRYGPRQEVDATELRAHIMLAALAERGVRCFLHWDRSPWGVRIPLIDDAFASPETVSDDNPSLYVLTEGPEPIAPGDRPVWTWRGSLGNFDEDGSNDLNDTMMQWIERNWLDDHTESVADMIVPFVQILKLGAAAAHQARRYRVTAALSSDEVETALRTLAEVYDNGDNIGRYLSLHQQEVAAKVLGIATVID